MVRWGPRSGRAPRRCARRVGRRARWAPGRTPRSDRRAGVRPAGASSCSTVTKKSRADEVLVVEQVVGRVERRRSAARAPGRRGRRRPRPGGGRTPRPVPGCGRSSPAGRRRRRTRGSMRSAASPSVSIQSTSVLPRLVVGDEQHEVHVATVAAREERRLGRRRLGVPARLPVHDDARVEPVRVGQLGVHRAGSRASPTSTSWPRPVCWRSISASIERHEREAAPPTGSPGRRPGGSAGSSGRRSRSCSAGCRGRGRRGPS